MRRSTAALGATLAMLALTRSARADIPTFPSRPDWDDTPLPMPEELAIALGVMALVAILYLLHFAIRNRRVER